MRMRYIIKLTNLWYMYAKSIMNMCMIVAYRSLQIRHTVYSLRVCHKSGQHQCICLGGSQTMCARVSIQNTRAIIYQFININVYIYIYHAVSSCLPFGSISAWISWNIICGSALYVLSKLNTELSGRRLSSLGGLVRGENTRYENIY